MLDQYIVQGRRDALARFKIAMSASALEGMSLPPSNPVTSAPRPADPTVFHQPGPVPPPSGGGVKGFIGGQLGAGKSLLGNLHQGLGGAPDAAAGAAARGAALGNLKTLAPSLLAGGALYMMHRHNDERDQQAQQQRMMMQQGGY